MTINIHISPLAAEVTIATKKTKTRNKVGKEKAWVPGRRNRVAISLYETRI